jgi:hypothetical protein
LRFIPPDDIDYRQPGAVGVGDLFVMGNTLCIIIPETWLSEAEYPVIVDPAIGTTTVGAKKNCMTLKNMMRMTNKTGVHSGLKYQLR